MPRWPPEGRYLLSDRWGRKKTLLPPLALRETTTKEVSHPLSRVRGVILTDDDPRMERTAAGHGDSYYTAVIRTIEKHRPRERDPGAFGDRTGGSREDVYPGPAPCVET